MELVKVQFTTFGSGLLEAMCGTDDSGNGIERRGQFDPDFDFVAIRVARKQLLPRHQYRPDQPGETRSG